MDRDVGLRRRRRLRRAAPLLGLALLPLVACEPTDPAVERVSASETGGLPNGPSFTPTISDNGRFVAFVSDASNIEFNDTNGSADVFVHDRVAGRTERASVLTGNGPSGYAPTCFGFELGPPSCTDYPQRPEAPAVSDDGRFVAFTSFASNLDGPVAAASNIYVVDRQVRDATLVSRSTAGAPGNGPSLSAAISGNGRIVTFWSYADNLVPGDTNRSPDLFAHDVVTGATSRVNTTAAGAQSGPSDEVFENEIAGGPLSVDQPAPVSDDGRYVGFLTVRTDLGPGGSGIGSVYRKDLQTGAVLRISDPAIGNRAEAPYISTDGNFVSYLTAFYYDRNRDAPCGSCFIVVPTAPPLRVVRNVTANRTTEVIPGNPFPGAPDVSGDGTLRVFALGGESSNVYLRHLPTTALVARHRINAGGPQFAGTLVKTWDADRGFVGGNVHTVTNAIGFTTDDRLYQSERWGLQGYDLAVPDGLYRVRLLVAEISPASGQRVFDVRAEGALKVDDFDIIGAGFHPYEATTLEFTVPVTDGQLDLDVSASKNAPTVAAIEVLDARLPDERI